MGCTEPVTVALACAHCRQLLGAQPLSVKVEVSANLYKNAAGVTVPGTGQQGLGIAAAAGFVAGDPDAGLEVLAGLTEEALEEAEQLLDLQVIEIDYKPCPDVLYTRVIGQSAYNECEVVIERSHSTITLLRLDDDILYKANPADEILVVEPSESWNLKSIVEFAESVALEDILFLQKAADLNESLSREGLASDYGLSVGRSMSAQLELGLLSDDLLTRAMMLSAAASDARMGGAQLAAMSNSGSGNQGIAATMPVIAACQVLNVEIEKQLRALAMSNLIAIYIKRQQDKLSALCAATTAAMGSAGAITWLLGGNAQQIDDCIQTMIGDVSGVLCDGAKAGCALKVSTGASSAVKSAMMALCGAPVRADGINGDCADVSIRNLGALSKEGMQATDDQVIAMIGDKQRNSSVKKVFG